MNYHSPMRVMLPVLLLAAHDTPEAREARIVAHTERVARELAALGPDKWKMHGRTPCCRWCGSEPGRVHFLGCRMRGKDAESQEEREAVRDS
jgi:hypothetical protein